MMIIKMKKTNRKQSDNKCRKMVIFKHLEENSGGFQETTDEYGYECKMCKKRFKSFQALGGHQGIHKRISKPNEDDMMCMLTLNIIPTGSLHQCKMCSKVFETGQMLGGHMRKHRLKKLDLWRQNEVLTMEELERRRAEVDEQMRVRRDLILAAKELQLWF
ncbi:zinc finger, C2H2 [Tanacetum coccineum]|uniref:Zinc finger, C2H2 n=1 Tax=Tanacetum coccineum TaxID=301880 RepID=A0ABQ5F8Q8_9ASTR